MPSAKVNRLREIPPLPPAPCPRYASDRAIGVSGVCPRSRAFRCSRESPNDCVETDRERGPSPTVVPDDDDDELRRKTWKESPRFIPSRQQGRSSSVAAAAAAAEVGDMAGNTMDAIKKKMQAMKLEKENAFDKADQLEQKLNEQKTIHDKQGEEIINLQKRITQLQSDVESAKIQLQETTDKLEFTNKQLANAESEVQALTKRVRSLEEEFELTEGRLQTANERLDLAIKAADESERGTKVLENRNLTDVDRIAQLEKELEATIFLGEESDRKYEKASRLLAVTEVDLERGDARLEAAEAKILELEEELKVVGNNKKSLEISEQEASQREEAYEEQIRDLSSKLNDVENRASEAEKLVIKLQLEVDRLEAQLATEKEKYKLISNDLDVTFAELTGF